MPVVKQTYSQYCCYLESNQCITLFSSNDFACFFIQISSRNFAYSIGLHSLSKDRGTPKPASFFYFLPYLGEVKGTGEAN